VIRVYFFALLGLSLMGAAAPHADVQSAPQPREIRPDGSRDPVPAPPKAEDPRETVERIIKNSKEVGDKLAMSDIGTDTRSKQGTILKDIQSLIKRQEDPPPQSDQNKDMNNDPKDKQSNDMDKKKDMMPMAGMNDPPPPGNGMDNQPMGNPDQPKTRKQRQQGKDESKEKGMDEHKDPNDNKNQSKGSPSQDTKQKNGGMAGQAPMGSIPQVPTIPQEDAVVKDVWGYLPDKLRQQTMQYYKQEVMPRYAKLLEHYYSSLSDKGMKK
jgi:hypothetical protein